MRRRHHDEHVNHEAWAIPYADLMTLLLAFFVVMYAVSVVNEGKYRVASEALAEAFNGSNTVIVKDASSKLPPKAKAPVHALPAASSSAATSGAADPQADLQRIEDLIRKALQPLIERKLVVVRGGPDRLEIEIRTDVLFPSGIANLQPSAQAVLTSMAGILAPFANSLRIEGFTDNVPIATSNFPSNWELSAARAASVARLFAEHGVNPDRLGIVGWGEVRPIADNATAEGRNQNRRVLVVVMGGSEPARRPTEDMHELTAGPSPPLVAAAASGASAPAAVVAVPVAGVGDGPATPPAPGVLALGRVGVGAGVASPAPTSPGGADGPPAQSKTAAPRGQHQGGLR